MGSSVRECVKAHHSQDSQMVSIEFTQGHVLVFGVGVWDQNSELRDLIVDAYNVIQMRNYHCSCLSLSKHNNFSATSIILYKYMDMY